VILQQAKQIDYLGAGIATNVPVNGLAFTSRDAYIDSGTVFTGTGGITIGAGRTLGIREGFSLGRDLTNHGVLAPGLQLGSITVQDFAQFADGQLNIQLAGYALTYVDTQYDRVIATDTALLGGKLSVSFLSGYVPKAKDTFDVVTAASILGTFSSFDLPMLPSGLVWNVSKSGTAFTLSVVSADFNHNGVVDMADYIVWRDARNTNVTPGSGADATGNGFVDDADYQVWRANFGNVQGTASGSGAGSLAAGGVPEPASLGLLGCSAAAIVSFRARRKRARV
jgi:hypothetical protein